MGPVESPLPDRQRRAGGLRLLTLLAALVVSLMAAHSLGPPKASEHKAPFNERLREQFSEQRPEVIFIGNSMLVSRLDHALLRQLVAPTRVDFIAEPGSMSARWYLQFKNHVLGSESRPRRVVFFFRGRDWTRPLRHVYGTHKSRVEADSTHYEPVLDAIMAGKRGQIPGSLEHWAAGTASISRLRPRLERQIDRLALRVAAALSPSNARIQLSRINALFELDRFRESRKTRAEPINDSDFESLRRVSFLSAVVDLARESGVELYFIRIKRRGLDATRSEPEAELDYWDKMKAYLLENGMKYRDMRYEKWVRADWYRDPSHIKYSKKPHYTRGFAQHVPEVLE